MPRAAFGDGQRSDQLTPDHVGAEVVDAACRQIPVVRSQISRDGLVADPGIRSALRAATGALVAHVAADSSVQLWPGERRRTTAVPIGERPAAEFAPRSPGDDTHIG